MRRFRLKSSPSLPIWA